MAVEVMHLSALPNDASLRSPTHSLTSATAAAVKAPLPSLGRKSHSASDLREQQQLQQQSYGCGSGPHSRTNSPSRSSGCESLSELSWCGSPEEQQAAERIQQSRLQLEDEIDVRL